ncbi:MAG TPA: cysteine-rich CWC family protein [Pyrinomonadaceae bacterium]|nr:cysteine-rich CWC family protein [Pyrinomonadaceae bacterium]
MKEELKIDRQGPPPAACAACGAHFSCGAASSSGCWCGGLALDEAARAELRARYEGCLCRACLEGYAAPGDGQQT